MKRLAIQPVATPSLTGMVPINFWSRLAAKPQARYWVMAILLGALSTGCSTYQQKNKIVRYWRAGDLPAATGEAQHMAEKNADDKDTIVWRLEDGAVLRADGRYVDSNNAFDDAQNRIDRYAAEAKVKVGHEAGALLSNQANLPYEGRAYDGIMLNTYEALNYMALGQTDKARPELIRAYQRQQDAVEANKKRIAKTEAEADENKNKAAMDRAQQDPGFQSSLQSNYNSLNNLKFYGDYVNPFTVFLDGLYFLSDAADTSDLTRAQKSFQRVESYAGANEYIEEDLAAVAARLKGQPLAPTTYVIFETGCAPERGQIRIDIPIIFSRVSYAGAAFPTLRINDTYVPNLTVSANGALMTTALLASMDSIIVQEFKNEMPVVITKTIAATVAKAAAAYAINEAADQQNPIGGLVAQIGTAVYEASVNIADTRTWTTLPKQFQYCRFPTPADRRVYLSTPDGFQKTTVTIPDGLINVIYVKSISPGTPLLVTQWKLK